MICLEVYRPEEIKFSLNQQEVEKDLDSSFYKNMKHMKKLFGKSKQKLKQAVQKLDLQLDKVISKIISIRRMK